ncbi:cytochrome B [Nitrogeniibacter mangrovi]|uniref:Cytochrome B n=1 Tax=Nitrogeniibacter mangrovi TaxID=2016596 RepID=A0A6C1B5G4_9RHOO|nr:cytochrome b/b6 domain-containing protein [Nitrogeniibacter mangrovi]QID18931.1 cytochrome B [Nitrogeniibacter mangrovi]
MTRSIRLWDLPTRLVHWSLVAGVVGAFVTAKIGGNLMLWHERIGLLLVGLLVFRLVWGFVGSTYARFGHFVRGPGAIAAYIKGQWRGIGHNPLGALSVLALLGLLAAQALTGLFANDDIAFNAPLYPLVSKDTSDALTGWHHRGEIALYVLVGLHLAAIVYYAVARRERLVPAMITGRRDVGADAPHRDARGGGPVAFIVALVLATAAVWSASGAFNPPPPPPSIDTPAW